ncbi:MAG: serine/threonine-protein kinase [Pseudomonadota bacterium]
MSASWAEIESLLDRLLDLPAEARWDTLRSLTSEYPDAVIEEVSRLLRGLDDHADAFDVPAATSLADTATKTGEQIGAWRLVGRLGQGGQADVFDARRDDGDLVQRGALKLLRRRLLAGSELRRFVRERQLLADLQHPGIPTLLDGGVLEDGRPYLVAEHVTGRGIDIHCDDHGLDTVARIDLVVELARVVAYAHDRLVVHRDLKPSNVLVDEAGRVRLLDFGIARLLDEKSMLTAEGAALTPAYAAPEQFARGAPVVANDVYGLGALTYSVLAGRPPFPQQELPALLRAVQDDDPETIDSIPADLDAVVRKALRKRPEDRYVSVRDFIDDLEAWRDGRAVRAAAGGRIYRFRKFLRRRWPAVAVVSLVFAAGAAWLVDSQRRQDALVAEQARTEAAAERAETMLSFITGSLGDLGIAGESASVQDFLLLTSQRVGEIDEPEGRLEMMTMLAGLLFTWGRYDEADALASAARELIGRTPAIAGTDSHRSVLDLLAETAINAGRMAEAEVLAAEAMAMARDDGDALAELRSGGTWGWALLQQQRGGEARERLEMLRGAVPESGDDEVLDALGFADIILGRIAGSDEERMVVARRALARVLAYQPNAHASHIREHVFVGSAAEALGEFDLALEQMRLALAAAEAAARPELADYALTQIALFERELGHHDAAADAIADARRLAFRSEERNRIDWLIEAEDLCLAASVDPDSDNRPRAERLLGEITLDATSSIAALLQDCADQVAQAASAGGALDVSIDPSRPRGALHAAVDPPGCAAAKPVLEEAVAPYLGDQTWPITGLEYRSALAACAGDVTAFEESIGELEARLGPDHWKVRVLANRAP